MNEAGHAANRPTRASRGVLGDRERALRDLETGRVTSAKRFDRLLDFRAGYEHEPTSHTRGRAWIRTPDGEILHTDDPGRLQAPLTTARPSRADRGPRRQGRERKHRPQHVFGDVPVSAMKPEWTPETMPDHFQLMSGTFLEIGPVHVLASGSVDPLRRLQGGTAQIDRRRFRTNIYTDSPTRGGGSLDQRNCARGPGRGFRGRQADRVVRHINARAGGAPCDLSILRTIAQHHRGCLGVYASVPSAGTIRVGDPVTLLR